MNKTIDPAMEPYIQLLNQLDTHYRSTVDSEVFVKRSQTAYEALYDAIWEEICEDDCYYLDRYPKILHKLEPLIKRAHALALKYQAGDVAQRNNLGPSVLAHMVMDQLMDCVKVVYPDSIPQ